MKIYSNGKMVDITGGVTMDQVKAAIDEKLEGFTAQEVYSTEETRIGTWIDGKPLYRRVYNLVMPGTSNSWQYLNVSVENAIVVMFRQFLLGSTRAQISTMPVASPNGYSYFSYINEPVGTTFTHAGVWAYNTHPGNIGLPAIIILEYTKTTDKATIQTGTQAAAADVIPLGYDTEMDIPVMPTTTTAQFYEEV